MIILGLIILVAAVVIGVVGVVSNSGSAHEFTGGFSVFGVDVTGSTGTLFLYGLVVGAAALLGLSLLLTGTRRTARRGRTARHGLNQSRRETAAAEQERDVLINERDSARAQTAQAERDEEDPAGLVDRPRHKDHWFRHRHRAAH
jgi:hypothetical protein